MEQHLLHRAVVHWQAAQKFFAKVASERRINTNALCTNASSRQSQRCHILFPKPFWKSFLALRNTNVAKATIVLALLSLMLPSRTSRMIINRNAVVKKLHMKAMWSRPLERFWHFQCVRLFVVAGVWALEAPPSSERGPGAPAHLHLRGQTQK